jgi:hypothetical protein
MVDAGGGAGPAVLLGEDDLLQQGSVPPAMFDRPTEPDPTGPAQLLLPSQTDLEPFMFPAWATPVAQCRVVADQVIGQPGGHLLAEGVVGLLNRRSIARPEFRCSASRP